MLIKHRPSSPPLAPAPSRPRRTYEPFWRSEDGARPSYGELFFRCRDQTHRHGGFRVQVLMKEASLRNRAIDELNRPETTKETSA